MSYLTYGAVYYESDFEPEFRNTFHPFLVVDVGEDGQPKWHFQPAGTQTIVKVGVPLNNTSNFVYLHPYSTNQLTVISQINVNTPLIIHFTEEFVKRFSGTARLIHAPMSIKRDGAQIQINYVFLATRPTNTREYEYVWPGMFENVTADAVTLFNTLPDVFVRLFTDRPTFCTDQFLTDFNAMGKPTPTKTPLIGEVFSDLVEVTIPHQVQVVTLDASGEPLVRQGTGIVYQASIPNASPNMGYFVADQSVGTYTLISFTGDFVYIRDDARAWLNKNHVLATTNGLLITGWTFPSNVLHFKPGSVIDRDVSRVKAWVLENTAAHARNIQCDAVLVQALHDAFQTLDPGTIPSLGGNDKPLPTVNQSTSTTIIYTRSMYVASLSFVNRTIEQLESEVSDEEKLKTQLSNEGDCIALKQSLETFVNTRSDEVETKLATLISRRDTLKSLIIENDALLSGNHELATFVAAPATVAVSNNIIKLRDVVYDAVSFLKTHARISESGASIYLLNRTQL